MGVTGLFWLTAGSNLGQMSTSIQRRCAHPAPCFGNAPWHALVAKGVTVSDLEPLALAKHPDSASQSDALWLADQPAGMQHSGGRGSPTRPGWAAMNSTATKYVELKGSEDASHAVQFAAAHKLAVSIKSTGHDWLGRSARHGSLLLWTHKMTSIVWHDSFTPSGCASSATGTAAVSLGAGVQFWQLYDEALTRHRMVVGGTCSTVGHVGFTLGGGYGTHSHMYGSGATNLLEAEVVLADGRVVVVSECNKEHADLFRALRGGGAGFALVTRMTYRTYSFPEKGTLGVIHGKLDGGVGSNGDAVEAGLRRFLLWYAGVVTSGFSKHFGGKLFIYRNYVQLQLSYVKLSLIACQSLVVGLGVKCTPADQDWKESNAINSSFGSKGWMNSWAPDSASSYFTETMSRYFRLEHVQGGHLNLFVNSLSQLAQTLPLDYKSFLVVNTIYALGHASDVAVAEAAETTVHPQVYEAVGMVKLFRREHPFVPAPNEPVNWTYWSNLQLFQTELDKLLPAMGSYNNEGDYTAVKWTELYWGSNYAELLQTQRKYDPMGLFSCFQCVGADPDTGAPYEGPDTWDSSGSSIASSGRSILWMAVALPLSLLMVLGVVYTLHDFLPSSFVDGLKVTLAGSLASAGCNHKQLGTDDTCCCVGNNSEDEEAGSSSSGSRSDSSVD